ncbi:hypothetical protein BVRB_7g172840 isoform A [Beta vulgaris subsp. vulgaris]|nr:hypothetical protein BVRB_7g172840 isoform A [Beta vulgaris subsp. vulgaris]
MDGLKEAAAGGEGKGGGRQNMRKRRRKWIYGGAMILPSDLYADDEDVEESINMANYVSTSSSLLIQRKKFFNPISCYCNTL